MPKCSIAQRNIRTLQVMLVHTQEGPGGPEQRILKALWEYMRGQGQDAAYGEDTVMVAEDITTALVKCYAILQ